MKPHLIPLIMTIGATVSVQAASAAEHPGQTRLIADANPGAQAEMTDANIFGLLEVANRNDIEAAQLAQQKGTHPKIKMFGHRMTEEHTSMLNDGAKTAKHLLVIPSKSEEAKQMRQQHEGVMQDLRRKSGQEFDRAYLEHEIEAHQKVLERVGKAIRSARQQELKQLLEKTRPALEDHLERAQEISNLLAS